MLSSTMSLSTEVLVWIELCQCKRVQYQADPLYISANPGYYDLSHNHNWNKTGLQDHI